jgi:hypothetical protein
MTPEKALARYYAGQYMVNTHARLLFDLEVSKGCEGIILPNPVALEPDFWPINLPKDIIALKDRRRWVFEPPPKQQELTRYQVWLSPDQPFNWDCLELFVKQLSLVSNRVGLEITGNQKRIFITLLCHRSDIPLITTAFLSKLKFCRLSVAAEQLVFNAEAKFWDSISFYDYFTPPPYSHLLTTPAELHATPYEALVTAIANILPPAVGIYQVLFQPVSAVNNWHRNVEILTDLEYKIKLLSSIGPAQRYEQQVPSGDIHQMAGDVDTKAHNDKPFYSAVFRIAVVGADDNKHNYLQSLKVFSGLFQHGGRPLNFITDTQYNSVLSPEQIRQMFILGLTYRPGSLLNSAELTGLVHFPEVDVTDQLDAEIDIVETLMITTDDGLSHGTPIGKTSIAGQERTICIPDRVRMRHIHLIGSMDMGKSLLLKNMALHDIMRGHGVAVIDPHGDLVKELLCLINEDAIARVMLFDPGNPDWIPLWNPMHNVQHQDKGRITDDLIGVLKSFVTGWGDRMEHLFRQSFLGLLHLPSSSLRDVYDILSNSNEVKKIRELVLQTVQNEICRQFWKDEIDKYKPDELGPPKNKLSKLLLSSTSASLMLSQPLNRFNFRHIMDDSMIFLADLSANLGTEVKEILGGFILALLCITALSRSDIPKEERQPFHLYIDEAHHFVTDKLESIIAETRKFNVSLILAHQYLGQFDVKKIGALGTVGTTIVFKVDSKDAAHLSKDFKKEVEVTDFIELEQGDAIVRCDNEIVKIKTLGPPVEPEKNFRDRIIAESRKKYYMSAAEVRRIIAQRTERTKTPFAPLAPVMDKHESVFLPGELDYDKL